MKTLITIVLILIIIILLDLDVMFYKDSNKVTYTDGTLSLCVIIHFSPIEIAGDSTNFTLQRWVKERLSLKQFDQIVSSNRHITGCKEVVDVRLAGRDYTFKEFRK